MNKKVLRCAVAVVVVAAAGYGAYQAQAKDTALSEIALANVEALANNEEEGNECRWERRTDSFGCDVWDCIKRGGGDLCPCGDSK